MLSQSNKRGMSAASGDSSSRSRRGPIAVVAVVAGLALTAALAGCQSGDQAATPSQGGSAASERLVDTITVNGTATVTALPDEAVITVSVETDGSTPAEALDANSQQAQAVIDKLKAEGVDEEAIDTQNVSVYPIRTYNPETGQESLSGYRAQNSVSVTLSDISQIGRVMAAATAAGSTNISGPAWRLADDAAATQQALQEATADARQKAEVLAAASNVAVGDVLAINESGTSTPPIVYEEAYRAAADSAGAVPPISPQELDVMATVTITYRIER